MAFQNISAGDTVEFLRAGGLNLRGEREYSKAQGKANRLLLFPSHVVLNIGGKYGTPQVVDENNFLRIVRKGRK